MPGRSPTAMRTTSCSVPWSNAWPRGTSAIPSNALSCDRWGSPARSPRRRERRVDMGAGSQWSFHHSRAVVRPVRRLGRALRVRGVEPRRPHAVRAVVPEPFRRRGACETTATGVAGLDPHRRTSVLRMRLARGLAQRRRPAGRRTHRSDARYVRPRRHAAGTAPCGHCPRTWLFRSARPGQAGLEIGRAHV